MADTHEPNRVMIYDFIIVGGGVSALAFASTLPKDCKYLIIEHGKAHDERDRDHPFDSMSGLSGAGLYSDGKFSFYPSAEKVYFLDNSEAAYALLVADLTGLLDDIPAYPTLVNVPTKNNEWFLKKYPSKYMSLENRFALVDRLLARIPKAALITETRVSSVTQYHMNDVTGPLFIVSTDKSVYVTKNVVFAGGRFSSIDYPFKKVFRRFEFGVRIQTPSDNTVMTKCRQIDPKFRYIVTADDTDPNGTNQERLKEFRTFCTIRKGEIVKTVHPLQSQLPGALESAWDSFAYGPNTSITTFSGRADCQPTELSNFGFNVIVAQESDYSPKDLALITSIPPFVKPLSEFTGNEYQHLSPLLMGGLTKLLERFPGLDAPDTTVHGPTIEGVGYYPAEDRPPGVHVIGDCSGVYRGIIAAMISGYTLAITLRPDCTLIRT